MPYYPPAGGSGITTEDEGVGLGTTSSLNFTGAGVTASGINPTVVNIAGGAGATFSGEATITGVPYRVQDFVSASISDANLVTTSRVIAGWAKYDDADENASNMCDVLFTPIPSTGSMVVRLSTVDPLDFLGGTYRIVYIGTN